MTQLCLWLASRFSELFKNCLIFYHRYYFRYFIIHSPVQVFIVLDLQITLELASTNVCTLYQTRHETHIVALYSKLCGAYREALNLQTPRTWKQVVKWLRGAKKKKVNGPRMQFFPLKVRHFLMLIKVM